MGELELAVEDPDLAGEHPAPARQQLLLVEVDAPAEEDELHPAAAVGDRDLQALALAPAALVEGQHAGVGHLRDHRDVLVQRQVGEGGELAALGVTPG